MAETLIDDIEDNYASYLDDTMGYRYDAWDLAEQDVILAHDHVLFAQDFGEIDSADLDDLSLWAYARRAVAIGDTDAFLQATRRIISAATPHEALAIDEVYLRAIDVAAAAGQFEDANTLLEDFSGRYEDHPQRLLAAAILAARQDAGRGHVALESLVEDEDDDEVWLDIVSELMRIGRRDLALTWIVNARTRLNDTKNATTLVDLKLLELAIKRA